MTVAKRIVLNPADKQSGYILWRNGFIEPIGNALPVPQEEGSINDWLSERAPTFYTGSAKGPGEQAIALQVIDWTGPSGYTLSMYGHVYAWGGATPSPGATPPTTTGPEYYIGTNGGFPSTMIGYVSDFVMNPFATGQGYILLYNGDVIGIGTGIAAISHSAFLSDTWALQLVMDWSSKRYWVLDGLGRIWGKNGGNNVGYDGQAAGLYIWGREGRGFRLYDKAATPKGWMVDRFGRVHRVGAAVDASPGSPFNIFFPQEIYQDIEIVDDGTVVNPLRLVTLQLDGQRWEYVVSTAPTVNVQSPSGSITTTTRPYVAWSYVDAQGNPQTAYTVKIFTDAVHAGGGFNADTSTAVLTVTGTGALTRVQVTLDLSNATYWAYVKATDSSGLSSGWAFSSFTISVTALSVPTVTPTVLGGTSGISLVIHATTGTGLPGTARFGVQFHDSDWDGVTWLNVRNGDALVPDGSGNATVVDIGSRFGILRSYRAITYIYDATTDVWRAGGFSSTQTATLTPRNIIVMTRVSDGSQMPVKLNTGFTLDRAPRVGVFSPMNRDFPVVQTDGNLKAPTFTLDLWILDGFTRGIIESMLGGGEVCYLRDNIGRGFYFKVIDNLTEEWLLGAPPVSALSSTRDLHELKVKCQTVKRPRAGPVQGPLVEA